MKVLKTIIIAALMALLAGPAFAAGAADLTVQATVLGTCSFDAGSYTMDFGNLDPAAAVNTSANATLDFTCSNGTPYTIDAIALNRNMAGGSTGALLPYTIDPYTNTGIGSGGTQSLALTGNINATAYDTASGLPADAYSETITININP